jgi:exopolysaccharide biosynthesis predicted pyruvyltransferase EpsI
MPSYISKPTQVNEEQPAAAAPISDQLRANLVASFTPLLADVHEVVVVGFGAHTNAGDSMIWLGQIKLLRSLDIKVRGVAQVGMFDERMLKRLPSHVAVVLTGGGSFGDLWPLEQFHRERIFKATPGRRVIQFPQSLCFRDETNVHLAQNALVQHGDVSLTWRDRHSYESALELFPETSSALVPDVAFALGPMDRVDQPKYPILCISRHDHEGGELCAVRPTDGIQLDWSRGGSLATMLRREPILAALALERRSRLFLGDHVRMAMYGTFASITVQLAKSLVSSGDVVVSDRLHAHILCVQLGIPHVMVDTRYGKISSFIDTWTSKSELVSIASTPRDAIERARTIAAARARNSS